MSVSVSLSAEDEKGGEEKSLVWVKGVRSEDTQLL